MELSSCLILIPNIKKQEEVFPLAFLLMILMEGFQRDRFLWRIPKAEPLVGFGAKPQYTLFIGFIGFEQLENFCGLRRFAVHHNT